MSHWATKYIGKKHVKGGRGPEEFDCWGLFCWIYQHEFGIEVPSLPNAVVGDCQKMEGIVMPDWERVGLAFEGCAVAMSQSKVIHHVGVFTKDGPGKVVHCWEGQHVIADSLYQLKSKGFRVILFYRHRLWPSS